MANNNYFNLYKLVISTNGYEAEYHKNFIVTKAKSAKNRLAPVILNSGYDLIKGHLDSC